MEFVCRGALQNLESCLSDLDTASILVVCGKTSFSASGAKTATEDLLSGYRVTYFDDFSANPSFEEALKGAGTCRAADASVIVAVGGGSAMDMGKLINMFQANPSE